MIDTTDMEMLLRFPIGCRVKVLGNGFALPVGGVGTVVEYGGRFIYISMAKIPGDKRLWPMYPTEIEEAP